MKEVSSFQENMDTEAISEKDKKKKLNSLLNHPLQKKSREEFFPHELLMSFLMSYS